MWLRLMGPFKEFGLGAGLLYMMDRLLRAVSSRLGLRVYELMVQPITDKLTLPVNLAKSLSFAEIGPDHPDLAQMPAREEIKRSRFEQGARCLGVYRRQELLGYLWYCRGRYEEDEVRCVYELTDAQRSIFDFDLFVMPKHRMGIGFAAIWHSANQYLVSQGVRFTFSRLTRFNLPSRRAHAHLGWRCVGKAVFLQAWRCEMMFATIAPHFALTFDRRVVLRLSPDAISSHDVQRGASLEQSR